MLGAIKEASFKPDRSKFTKKVFRNFDNVFTKLRSMAFLHPSISVLETMLHDIVDMYVPLVEEPQRMHALGSQLQALSDPAAIDRICSGYTTPAETMSAFEMAAPQPEPEPVSNDKPDPVAEQFAKLMQGFF